ncbi:hypothetical protein LTR70_007378 [Exophiala xenobiotica]|uniref:Uncharacterized protein n=1 Tax=Lithohypha guttulata TaxID=1690604 RepID=A0ABR0K4R3_9EURO|nr:hypothetical protein LTR24_006893 [Lithohypha guttulata]KAK5313956.1 hypothetical protein LTR70_007378 [Exophiala xenobiotica]
MDTSTTNGSANRILATPVKPAPLPRPVEHSVRHVALAEASTNQNPNAVADSERTADKSREERDRLGATPEYSDGTADTA